MHEAWSRSIPSPNASQPLCERAADAPLTYSAGPLWPARAQSAMLDSINRWPAANLPTHDPCRLIGRVWTERRCCARRQPAPQLGAARREAARRHDSSSPSPSSRQPSNARCVSPRDADGGRTVYHQPFGGCGGGWMSGSAIERAGQGCCAASTRSVTIVE